MRSLFTIVEVVAALLYMHAYPNGDGPRMLLNLGFFILFSLLKAGFIVGEFMHVRYESAPRPYVSLHLCCSLFGLLSPLYGKVLNGKATAIHGV